MGYMNVRCATAAVSPDTLIQAAVRWSIPKLISKAVKLQCAPLLQTVIYLHSFQRSCSFWFIFLFFCYDRFVLFMINWPKGCSIVQKCWVLLTLHQLLAVYHSQLHRFPAVNIALVTAWSLWILWLTTQSLSTCCLCCWWLPKMAVCSRYKGCFDPCRVLYYVWSSLSLAQLLRKKPKREPIRPHRPPADTRDGQMSCLSSYNAELFKILYLHKCVTVVTWSEYTLFDIFRLILRLNSSYSTDGILFEA